MKCFAVSFERGCRSFFDAVSSGQVWRGDLRDFGLLLRARTGDSVFDQSLLERRVAGEGRGGPGSGYGTGAPGWMGTAAGWWRVAGGGVAGGGRATRSGSRPPRAR